MSSVEVEAYDVTRLPAERGHDSLVRPAADTHAIKQSFQAYSDLCEQLLTAEDHQDIGGKKFRKKSGWRKLGVAFGVSLEMRSEQETRDDRGRIIRAKTIVRAIAPNGRFSDGLGVADIFEKCCQPGCSKGGKHRHCAANCPGVVHFSGVEHDIPATAYTRAANRAQSDLFGMGEVSAEEITDGEQGGHTAGLTPEQEADGWARENGWVNGTESINEAKKHVRSELKKRVDAGMFASSKATELWQDYLRPGGESAPRTLVEHSDWWAANMPELDETATTATEGAPAEPDAQPAPAGQQEPLSPADSPARPVGTVEPGPALADVPTAADYPDNDHRGRLDEVLRDHGPVKMNETLAGQPRTALLNQLHARGVERISTAWDDNILRSLLGGIVFRNQVADAAKTPDGAPF